MLKPAALPLFPINTGIYEMSNRTGEPTARPVQPIKHTLNALARKPVCTTMELVQKKSRSYRSLRKT
jgi:hypothetical protein